MSIEHVTFSCGHDGELRYTPVRGMKSSDQRRRIAWIAAQRTCVPCTEIARAEERAADAAANRAAGLALLTGTPKQIAYAESIRAELHPQILAEIITAEKIGTLDADMAERTRAALRSAGSASWWIDLAGTGPYAITRLMVAEVRTWMAHGMAASPVPPDSVAPILTSDRPPASPLVADLRLVADQRAVLDFPAPDATVMACTRAAGFRWSGRDWRAESGEMTGRALDRAADVLARLLSAGVRVRCAREDVADLARSGAYQPFSPRWIVPHEDPARVAFHWEWGGDMDDIIFTLPGVRRIDRAVTAPADAHDAILDMAERYGFNISAAARERMEAARRAKEMALLLIPACVPDLRVPKTPTLAWPDAHAGIDADLRDDVEMASWAS